MQGFAAEPLVRMRFIASDPSLPWPLRFLQSVPLVRTIVRTPVFALSLLREIPRADVVHVFSASYWSFLLGPGIIWFVARSFKKPVLLNYHSGEAEDHIQNWPSARFLLRRMAAIVVPSRYLEDVFSRHGFPTECISNVIDLQRFKFRRRAPLRPVLVCTRGFEPYYKVTDVVQAFAAVRAEQPEAQLHLVGHGSLESDVRTRVAALKLDASVIFHGAVSADRTHAIYDDADIFINASILDNMPVSLMEALACGLPVVTTGPGGIPFLVQDGVTALVSAVQDPAALAKNVLRLLNDPGFAERLAVSGRSEAEKFSWENVKGSWIALYQRLAGHSS